MSGRFVCYRLIKRYNLISCLCLFKGLLYLKAQEVVEISVILNEKTNLSQYTHNHKINEIFMCKVCSNGYLIQNTHVQKFIVIKVKVA